MGNECRLTVRSWAAGALNWPRLDGVNDIIKEVVEENDDFAQFWNVRGPFALDVLNKNDSKHCSFNSFKSRHGRITASPYCHSQVMQMLSQFIDKDEMYIRNKKT